MGQTHHSLLTFLRPPASWRDFGRQATHHSPFTGRNPGLLVSRFTSIFPPMHDTLNSPWRLLAATIYSAPTDSKIFGTLEVDVTDLEAYIKSQRSRGNKLTMTHFVAAALARSLAFDAPEINCYLRRGRFIPRDYVDVMVSVNLRKGHEMGGVLVRDAHRKSVPEISGEIRGKAFASRQGQENRAVANKYLLSKIPWPLRNWIFRGLRWLSHGLGLSLPFLGISHSSFGSILLSNIGTHGLATGMPALLPAAQLPAVVVMGKVEQKAVVRDGQVTVRSMLPLTGAFDHRIVDGSQAGKLARGVARRLAQPAELAEKPVRPQEFPSGPGNREF